MTALTLVVFFLVLLADTNITFKVLLGSYLYNLLDQEQSSCFPFMVVTGLATPAVL
jgi:hypothetical protein